MQCTESTSSSVSSALPSDPCSTAGTSPTGQIQPSAKTWISQSYKMQRQSRHDLSTSRQAHNRSERAHWTTRMASTRRLVPRSPFLYQSYDEWVDHRNAMQESKAALIERRQYSLTEHVTALEQAKQNTGLALCKLSKALARKTLGGKDGAVLCQPTIWRPLTEEEMAHAERMWPTAEEFSYEGTERMNTRGGAWDERGAFERHFPMIRDHDVDLALLPESWWPLGSWDKGRAALALDVRPWERHPMLLPLHFDVLQTNSSRQPNHVELVASGVPCFYQPYCTPCFEHRLMSGFSTEHEYQESLREHEEETTVEPMKHLIGIDLLAALDSSEIW